MSENQSTAAVQENAPAKQGIPHKAAGKKGGKKKKSLRKKLIILGVILVFLGAAAYIIIPKLSTTSDEDKYYTSSVTKGDISEEVSGSGTVTPIKELKVSTSASGEIVSDYIEEGAEVKEGDLLYVVDHGDVDTEIQAAQLNLQKAQQTYASTLEDIAGMTVKAPFTGVLTTVNVAVGDNVQDGATLAVLTDTSHLTITLPFNASDMSKISVGAKATVILTASGDKLTGTVTRKYTGTSVSSTGAIISNVEVTVSNTGGISAGDAAAVVIGNVSCNSPGTFASANEKKITASTGGTVETLNYLAGDSITSGSLLLTISNDQTLLTLESNKMSVTNAQTALENAQNKLDNYNIKSTISGTVIQKDYSAGDDLEGYETLAVIANMTTVTFEVSVDELDITNIKKGQSVSVTADALTSKTFTGTVTYVSSIGTTSNGVTTYPVTVTVKGGMADGLKMDMNVTGVITVNSVSNVLRVPIAAVVRGNKVLVKKSTGTTSTNTTATTGTTPTTDTTTANTTATDTTASGKTTQSTSEFSGTKSSGKTADGKTNGLTYLTVATGELPEGYEYVQVTTGTSNDTYIEIQSGLSEGDTIAIPIEETETATGSASGILGGLTGGGGNMPSGGMPSGTGGPPSGNWSGGTKSSSSSSSGSSSRGNG